MPSDLPIFTGYIPDEWVIIGFASFLLGMGVMWLMQRELKKFEEREKGGRR